MREAEYKIKKYEEAIRVLPSKIQGELLWLEERDKERAEEIRIRAGRGVSVLLPEGERRIRAEISEDGLRGIIERASGGSLHSTRESIKAGYVTAPGGHRIGICGTAIVNGGEVSGFRSISSVSVRISKEIKGAADGIMEELYEGGRFLSTLIVSPPGGGKTTLLRDIVRRVSDSGERVSLADERGEIASMRNGEPEMDIGRETDVIELCPRAEAVMYMLRAMNPEVIAMDEITNRRDSEALESAMGCGVRLLATAHSGGSAELMSRELYRRLIGIGMFERIVYIRRAEGGRREYETEKGGISR